MLGYPQSVLAWAISLCLRTVQEMYQQGQTQHVLLAGSIRSVALCHAQGPLEELPDAVEGEPVAGTRRGDLWSFLEAVRRPLARGLNMSARNVFIAGTELGGWAFTANAIMVSCS